jgi:DNA mismatch repair protein MLH1
MFAGFTEIIKQCMYVGMADDVLALAQCKTRLYVLNVVNLR